MRAFSRYSLFALLLAVLLCLPDTALAQTAPLSSHVERYALDSGFHDNQRVAGVYEAYSAVVEVPGAPWLRLSFSDLALGTGSYLTVASRQDGAEQRLDAAALARWQNTSAYFNGDAVEVKLFVAPGEEDVFVRMEEVVVGDEPPSAPESQCGPTDDRTPSNNPAAGRLLNIGCTAWIITGGKLVSAGHCVASASSANVVEFNVPPSLPSGTLQHPGPEDQYTVDTGSIVSANGSIGNDWGVFRVFDNTQTGLQPLVAQQAAFTVVRDLGPPTIRITGYGVDSGTANQTQQTHTGPNAGSSGTTMRYKVDTEGGNSGSPVIDEATGNAVGVHTNGGCLTSGSGSNSGTSTFNASFWDEIDGVEPIAAFDPDPSIGLEVTLAPSTTGTATLTLLNDGNENLTYDFLQFSRAAGGSKATPEVPHLELGKDEADPRRGTAPTRGLGGPDAFGYGWIDSNEPDGPVFDFIDIAGTGTPLNLSDDDGEFVPLPFAFEFYGDDKTQVGISSNGYLTFDASDSTPSDFTNDAIPDDSAPNDLIAVYWDDFNPGLGGDVYYQNLGDGRFVVQWNQVPHFNTASEVATFQAILNNDGTILFQYLSFIDDASDPNSGTIGIENADGTIGLPVAVNTPYIEDGLAVLIGQVPGFITGVSPATGSVAPGESVAITVSVSAEGLLPGMYTNVLAISTNEPATYTYPVRLEVTGVGGIIVAAEPQNPPVVLGPPGGMFRYDVTLTNATLSTQSFQAWVGARLPDGRIVGPVEGPRSITLPAGRTVGPVTLEANVPAQAPAGIYTVAVRVGAFPDMVEGQATFMFAKTGSAQVTGEMTPEGWALAEGLDALAAEAEAATGEATASTALPTEVALAPAFPNPFARQATLGFALPTAAEVRLAVYDVLGREVAVLADGRQEAGEHAVVFDGAGLAGGVYLVRLDVGGQVQTQRLTLLR